MGETTHHVIRAIEEDKDSNLEYEITEFKERPIKRGRAPLARKISTFRTGKKIKIDSIEIEPIHVDHSLPGCYGMIINTSSGTLVYTGDLRMHGTRPDLTRDFIQKASEAKLDWMLCEGTRISETNVSDEESVYRTCHQYTEKANDQDLFVFADYSYKDIDRFQTFYRIAKDSGRKTFGHAEDRPLPLDAIGERRGTFQGHSLVRKRRHNWNLQTQSKDRHVCGRGL